ncbi:hypothetical protein F5148DRAFT_1283317 [Russula earlei]|uniref:Uncharacterized protein n=1 Tax=Russula earlei TaxID=71964 RepID=A0ACC0UBZ1_9AGAM|nr:hypothetical protein F5148DRAFT_1283317 [Russula earlei]
MPPKKQQNQASSSSKVKVDKTFGMNDVALNKFIKYKNKSAKVRKQVAQIQAQASTAGKSRETLAKEREKELRAKEKAEEEKRRKEEAALFKLVQTQKVPFGMDPKTVLCEVFKVGRCEKGSKCKFSHDRDVERRVEKGNLYEDNREDKLTDTMDNWDEEKLRTVILSKHGNSRTTTDVIVCKYFIEAVETQKFGWFWQCPNGDSCQYRHALPPGFVLKSQRKALEEAEKANMISLEEFLDVERHKRETFAEWKQTRMDKKEAEADYNPEWFQDPEEEEEDWDLSKYRRQEDEDLAAENKRIRLVSTNDDLP